MGRKSLVCLNIAIIGNGKMTSTLSKCFASAGHNVFIGEKEVATPVIKKTKNKKFDNVSHTTIESAIIVSDLVIITAPMDEVREIAYRLGDVRRKVIIDATAFNLSRFGQHVHTSSVLKSITGCQHIVKCYNKTGYEDLIDENVESENVEVFMAGDSKKAKELTKLLARDLEMGECYDFGDDSMISTLDEMSICWQTQAVANKENTTITFRQLRAK
jgi:8-hydroxy-5-deazaflavin:NADPH oxidoreductase